MLFVCLEAHAQASSLKDFGLNLFEIVKGKEIKKFGTLLPSYDLFLNDCLIHGVTDYRRTLSGLQYSEAETETAVRKLIEEIKSKEARRKFEKYRMLLNENFLEILNEGSEKGIVWQDIHFLNFKAEPIGPDANRYLGKLLFAHKSKVFTLEVEEMVQIGNSYFGAELRLVEGSLE